MQSLTSSMDQGILYQILWNGLHGHLFESTLSSQLSTNVVHGNEFPALGYHRLGQHFTPTLVLWMPLVALMGKWALPLIQVLLISLASIILYKLAKCRLENNLARMLTFSFLGANAVIGPCLGNFTDLCQLPICFFSLMLGLEKRIKWLVLLTAFAIPLIREDAGILLIGVAIWLMYVDISRWKTSLLLVAYGLGWVLLVTNVLMPIFSEDSSRRFMVENFGQYLKGKDQASTIEVFTLAIQQPFLILKELFYPFDRTIKYVLGQFLPLAFIPFISIDTWLLMGFPLTGLLLAKGNPLAINWRYTYLVVPGLFSGVIYWWQNHTSLFKSRRFRKLWIGFIALSLIFTLTSNPNRTISFLMPQSINPWVYRSPIKQWKHSQIALNLISNIPNNASISASNCLIPHLASREILIRFPYHINYQDRQGVNDYVDWIAVDLDEHSRYAHAFRNEWRDLQSILDLLLSLDDIYNVQFIQDGVVILQKDGDFSPELEIAYQKLLESSFQIKLQGK